jgi:hypothetical protein
MSSNGNHAHNAMYDDGVNPVVTALKPVWVDGVINGLPVVRFSAGLGAQSTLMQSMPNVIGELTGLSAFVVGTHRTPTAWEALVGASESGWTNWTDYFNVGITDFNGHEFAARFNMDATYTHYQPNGAPDADPHLHSTVWTGGLQNYYDGTTSVAYQVDDVDTFGFTNGVWVLNLKDEIDIGGYDHFSDLYGPDMWGSHNLDVAEVLIYNTNLSAEDRAAVNAYLGEKYGLPYPEPTTLALLGLGGLFLRRRRA